MSRNMVTVAYIYYTKEVSLRNKLGGGTFAQSSVTRKTDEHRTNQNLCHQHYTITLYKDWTHSKGRQVYYSMYNFLGIIFKFEISNIN